MQKPSLSSYGLSEGDIAEVDRWEKRVAAWTAWICSAAGAVLGFFFMGVVFESPGWAIGGAFLYGGGGYMIAPDWIGGPIAKSFDSRVRRLVQFRSAKNAFDVWVNQRRQEELRSLGKFWQSLSGHQFEQELAALFKRDGYKVELTPGSGDQGIDILLRRSGRTTVVQCKRTKTPVGPAVGRELYGTLKAFKADDGILAATGGVTSGVEKFFSDKPLRVMDLSEILNLQQRLSPKTQTTRSQS